MNFKPLNDKILVKRFKEDEKTSGGIFIPENAKEKPLKGEVIALGKGVRLENGELVDFEIKVGDTVFFNKWGSTDIKIDGEDFLVMKESDILGVIVK